MAAGMTHVCSAMMMCIATAWSGATLVACSGESGTPAPTPETVKPEPVKPEPVKPEPVKPEPVKPDATTPANPPTTPAAPTTPATTPTTPTPPDDAATPVTTPAASGGATLDAARDPMATPANPKLETTKIEIDGKEFELEMALTDETRFHGLSGRTDIPERGGMIFVFPRPITTAFVMRDCPVPIDIIYLNAGGRITAMYAMQPEPARSEAERVNVPPFMGAPEWTWTNPVYEARLKKYPSRASTQFVIELKGGTLEKMSLKPGQLIEFDRAALVKKAK